MTADFIAILCLGFAGSIAAQVAMGSAVAAAVRLAVAGFALAGLAAALVYGVLLASCLRSAESAEPRLYPTPAKCILIPAS